jgi:hypothetical protein
LHEEFPHIDVYLTNSADLLFVSSASPLPALDAGRVVEKDLAGELARVGLAGQGDYGVRRIGSQDLLAALVRLSGAEPHSDFHPVVSLEAPKARFMGSTARQLLTLMSLGMPVLEMTDGRSPVLLDEPVQFASTSIGSELHWVAGGVRVAMVQANTSILGAVDAEAAQRVARLRELSVASPVDTAAWLEAVAPVAEYSLGHLREPDLKGLWIDPTWIDQAAQPEAIRAVLAAYSAAARRDAAAMAREGKVALDAVGEQAPALVKEQLLTILLLGALNESGPAEVAAMERLYGGRVPPGGSYGIARAYLLAWADSARP